VTYLCVHCELSAVFSCTHILHHTVPLLYVVIVGFIPHSSDYFVLCFAANRPLSLRWHLDRCGIIFAVLRSCIKIHKPVKW